MLALEAKNRDTKENLEKLRKSGLLPAVFYGKNEASTPVSIPYIDFLKVWKEAGESTVVTLKRTGGDLETLIKEIDFDPISGNPRHADFYVFEKGHKLEVQVPLEFVGVAPGVKDFGGLLVKVLHEIKVEAMPKDLPHQLNVDVTVLTEIGSQLFAKNITLPSGVSLVENDEEVIALIAAPKEEEEEEMVPVDLSAIEVEKKGKEKNGDEGGEETAETGETAEKKEKDKK